VRRLDALVVTHAQLDHDGAAGRVLGALPVGIVVDGRDGVRSRAGDAMGAAVVRRHIRLVPAASGEVVRAGRLELRIVWPPREAPAAHRGGDPNARAVVSVLSDERVRLLLTADVESDVLDGLDLPAVDMLKVAHHGSADPGLPALLARLRPQLAVVSVGRGNPYGHPAPATLDALHRAVPHVYRTDRDGTVRVDAGHGALVVRVHA
jgi:competence protein ComEC